MIVPDYLDKLVSVPARHTLSWHTAGGSPSTLHFKPADLPRYAVIDSGGYSGWSTMASTSLRDALEGVDLVEARAFCKAHKSEVTRSNISKYSQNPASRPPNFDYVFVALQTAQDRTQQCAYIPMLTMLDDIVDRFRGSPISVVVKRHPLCADDTVARRLLELSAKKEIILRNDSIHSLVAGAKAVMTVNSGVGSEALIHGKPVYTFGACDYSAATHVVKSACELRKLTTPIRPAVTESDLVKFIWHYRTRYLVNVGYQERLNQVISERLFGRRSIGANRTVPFSWSQR